MSEAGAVAGIGHNSVHRMLSPQEVAELLAEAHKALVQRTAELAAGMAAFAQRHPVIDDPDIAAAATENLNMTRRAIRVVDERRRAAKEPFLTAERALDAWFKGLTLTLEAATAQIEGPAKAYAERIAAERREAARQVAMQREAEADRAAAAARAAAEAARPEAQNLYDTAIASARAAEQAERHAAMKPQAFSRVVGSFGAISNLRETWDVEVLDVDLVPREYMTVDMADLRRAAAAGVRDIPGCRIYAVDTLRTNG